MRELHERWAVDRQQSEEPGTRDHGPGSAEGCSGEGVGEERSKQTLDRGPGQDEGKKEMKTA